MDEDQKTKEAQAFLKTVPSAGCGEPANIEAFLSVSRFFLALTGFAMVLGTFVIAVILLIK